MGGAPYGHGRGRAWKLVGHVPPVPTTRGAARRAREVGRASPPLARHLPPHLCNAFLFSSAKDGHCPVSEANGCSVHRPRFKTHSGMGFSLGSISRKKILSLVKLGLGVF
jgi:hypothetical protein